VNSISQRLGYLVRCGDPDALDSIVPMAFGNLALDLALAGRFGRLVNIRNGRYDNVPIDVVTSKKKMVDLDKYYVADRLRPRYEDFENKPVFIMTSDY
jgi:6-phosphofructokinase 1